MTIEMELDKLLEEVKELKQAYKCFNYTQVDSIVEELADCYVALKHTRDLLQEQFKFSNEELTKMQEYKRARTERRFKEGYYGK